MAKFLLTLLTLFTFINIYAYPVIKIEHPRLYISQERFNYLDSHKTQLPVSTFYNQFVSNYFGWWYNVPDFYLVGNDSTNWNYNFRYFNANEAGYRDDVLYTGLFTAFIFKLNHDPIQFKRTRYVIRRFNAAVDTMNYGGYSGDNLESMLRYFGMLGSALYDWCYSDIDSTSRDQLASAMYKLNRKYMSSFINTSGGNSYVSSHNAWNCVLTLQNIISINGSSALTAQQQDTLTNWYHTLCDKWETGFFPVYGYYRSTSGGWNWGAAYSFWGLPDQFTLFDNFLNGTDKNYYQDMPWIQNSINQYYYMLRPDNVAIHLGDGDALIVGSNVPYRHAAVYSDQRSRWFSQVYSSPQMLTSTYTYFNILCSKDFTAPVVTKPNLPLNWISDRVGLLVSRSSWDSNAVQYWMFNSHSKKAAHEHRDNNTFSIFYKKPLLIDAGYYDSYGSSHYYNYYSRTIAHNTVTVFDSTEQFYVSGNLVSNDGGQLWSDPMMNYSNIFQTQYQRGRWIVYASDTAYVYSNTDATLSYNSQKLKRYLRKIVYLKPNCFVVLDNIILRNTILSGSVKEVRWNAHFKNQPQINGQIINTQVPDHIETFNGKNYISANSSAYININTIFPDSTVSKRIGGNGYEYWVNGLNYPPIGNPDTVYATAGKWRVEVIPKLSESTVFSDTVNMLHTLSVNNVGVPPEQLAVRIKNENTLGCDYLNRILLFNVKGDTGTTGLNASGISGNRSIVLYCFDLKRNSAYNLLVDGININQISSDSTGIIVKEIILSSGIHNIQVTLNSLGIQGQNRILPESFNLYQNYPNPFNSSTVFKYDVPFMTDVKIILYDITGKFISEIQNSSRNAGRYSAIINSDNLSSGVYFLKMTAGNYIYAKRIVILK